MLCTFLLVREQLNEFVWISLRTKSVLCCGSFLCVCGGLWGVIRFASCPAFWLGAASVSSLSVVFFIKQLLKTRSNTKVLGSLHSSLTGLEKVFIQYKRMLLLVYQSDLISASHSWWVLNEDVHTGYRITEQMLC